MDELWCKKFGNNIYETNPVYNETNKDWMKMMIE